MDDCPGFIAILGELSSSRFQPVTSLKLNCGLNTSIRLALFQIWNSTSANPPASIDTTLPIDSLNATLALLTIAAEIEIASRSNFVVSFWLIAVSQISAVTSGSASAGIAAVNLTELG